MVGPHGNDLDASSSCSSSSSSEEEEEDGERRTRIKKEEVEVEEVEMERGLIQPWTLRWDVSRVSSQFNWKYFGVEMFKRNALLAKRKHVEVVVVVRSGDRARARDALRLGRGRIRLEERVPPVWNDSF